MLKSFKLQGHVFGIGYLDTEVLWFVGSWSKQY